MLSNPVLQTHWGPFKYMTEQSGFMKNSDISITEIGSDGQKKLRFQPTPAWQTPASLQELHLHS